MRHPFDFFSPENEFSALIVAAVVTVVVAFGDWLIIPDRSLGLIYLFPLAMVAASSNRITLAGAAIILDILREQFRVNPWGPDATSRIFIAFLAYFGTGLFISEAMRNRRSALVLARNLAAEVSRRESFEQQLRSLVEGSPAAIITVDAEGKVLLANEAAHELLKCGPHSLNAQSIDEYIPTLAGFRQSSSLRKLVRTMLECTCHRRNGETFLAHVWVSSAGPPSKTGLSAVVFDASEQLRSREEGTLHTLTLSARIIAGSFFHEVRNLCSAIRVLTTKLSRQPGLMDTEEVDGLNALANGLEKLVSSELHPKTGQSFDTASLRAVLDHLRIVIEPWFEDSDIKVTWHEAANLPLVRADQHAVLQVFLNLARNARRALEQSGGKEFDIRATVEDGGKVVVRFRNVGAPPEDPETLFQPFARREGNTGIGLYVSKAIVRSFGGDLRYDATPDGPCFSVVLEPRVASKVLKEAQS